MPISFLILLFCANALAEYREIFAVAGNDAVVKNGGFTLSFTNEDLKGELSAVDLSMSVIVIGGKSYQAILATRSSVVEIAKFDCEKDCKFGREFTYKVVGKKLKEQPNFVILKKVEIKKINKLQESSKPEAPITLLKKWAANSKTSVGKSNVISISLVDQSKFEYGFSKDKTSKEVVDVRMCISKKYADLDVLLCQVPIPNQTDKKDIAIFGEGDSASFSPLCRAEPVVSFKIEKDEHLYINCLTNDQRPYFLTKRDGEWQYVIRTIYPPRP